MNEEERIRRAFENKRWPEIKISDSWAIFKIMAEFVEGFEKMSRILTVSIAIYRNSWSRRLNRDQVM